MLLTFFGIQGRFVNASFTWSSERVPFSHETIIIRIKRMGTVAIAQKKETTCKSSGGIVALKSFNLDNEVGI